MNRWRVRVVSRLSARVCLILSTTSFGIEWWLSAGSASLMWECCRPMLFARLVFSGLTTRSGDGCTPPKGAMHHARGVASVLVGAIGSNAPRLARRPTGWVRSTHGADGWRPGGTGSHHLNHTKVTRRERFEAHAAMCDRLAPPPTVPLCEPPGASERGDPPSGRCGPFPLSRSQPRNSHRRRPSETAQIPVWYCRI